MCSYCYSPDHLSTDCHMQPPRAEEANYMNAGWRRPEQQFNQGYNQNQRQHPGFQWSNPQGGQYAPTAPYQPPHLRQGQFQALTQDTTAPTKLEEMFAAFMTQTHQQSEENKQTFKTMQASISELKMQVGQLASNMSQREPGRFPSQPEVNPREHEHAKAITTLRSGKIVDNKVDHSIAPEIEEEHEHEHEATVDDESPPLKEKEASDLMKPVDLEHYKEKAPFPHLLARRKKDSKAHDILEIFKKVEINIPLLSAISQIPAYAKFLKNLCTNKRKFQDQERVLLSHEVSAIFQNQLPPKLDDPGCFSIPCTIGDRKFLHGLMDLGSSINVMPYAIFEELKLGELKKTSITVQLADRSIRYPRGIVEDVLVKVEEFLLPADFVVMDSERLSVGYKELSIILGRPFMATAGAKVDVKAGTLSMNVLGETVEFKIFKATRYPDEALECSMIDVLDEPIQETFEGSCSSDYLDLILTNDSCMTIEHLHDPLTRDPMRDMIASMEATPFYSSMYRPRFESLPASTSKLLPSIIEAPKLELKPLPEHLKYIFLGDAETLPVIIAADLSDEEEGKLMQVLKKYREAIGWSIADIKGISPAMCMHRILMEDDVKPHRDAQRRLNPAMKEVVRNEILKLLDVGVIFPISDSKWVSPIHVVPKKSGITVVKNANDEMVPTRIQTGWRVCIDYRKLNTATRKDHLPLPFIDQMLERLAGHSHYCFLDGYSGYNQIPIAPEDQEKTTFTCPYGTYAYRRMPFGLCNAPATFQRCILSIFSDMVERCIKVFMDDFSVYGSSFDSCLENLSLVLERCVSTNLVLNWEKCHFMVKKGIVLGHVISKDGIEVDKAKVELISDLPPPRSVREIRAFLGHAGFYRRFIKDFSKLARPLTNLLSKDVKFDFDSDCLQAFNKLKELLTTAPILKPPDWSLPFELMCDASDYSLGAVLGQKVEKKLYVIYYASRTMNEAQINYTTTEKEFLAIIFAIEKFRPYLIGTKVTIYTDHATIKYLLAKKDAKPRLIRWILLLQEFDLTILNKKGSENLVADHMSRLPHGSKAECDNLPLREEFPDEQLFEISTEGGTIPWYAPIVNYICVKEFPPHYL